MRFLILTKRIAVLIIISLYAFSCNTVEPPTPLPEYDSIDEAPAWSPDGGWIAYHHFNKNPEDSLYPTGLYIIDTNGNNRRLVISGPAYNPDWSPDGNEIAFRYDEIYSIKIDGSGLRQITSVGQAYFPSWSPDGNKIAFDSDYNDSSGSNAIWVINSEGDDLVDISQHGTGEWRMPDWSCDMRNMLHIRYISISTPEIYIMDSTGGNSQRLTFNEVFDLFPRWSYDGEKITWTSGNNQNEIWIMSNDGTNQYYLTEGYYSCWSPDTKRIVYSKPVNNKIALFIIDIETKIIKQLTF
jgi:Tol biopolymer transport system component